MKSSRKNTDKTIHIFIETLHWCVKKEKYHSRGAALWVDVICVPLIPGISNNFLFLSKTHLKSDSWCSLSKIPLNGDSPLKAAVAISLSYFPEDNRCVGALCHVLGWCVEESDCVPGVWKKNLYSFKMDVLQTVSRVGVKHNRGTCYSYCYGWIGDSILRVCVLFITHELLHLCTISPQKLALFEIWVSMLLVKLIYFGKHLVFIDIIELQQSQSIVF